MSKTKTPKITISDSGYVSVADTAKLVRHALRQRFPAIKFSVRSHSYAGGASIDVHYTDGPLERDVREILSLYEGSHGEQNGGDTIKMPHSSLLADETGAVQTVHFAADYVFAHRAISPAREALAVRELQRFIDEPVRMITREWGGQTYRHVDPEQRVNAAACTHEFSEFYGQLVRDDHGTNYASSVVRDLARCREWHDEICPGGDANYCPGCGRYQGDHRAPHKR